jgi:hypothetical protein
MEWLNIHGSTLRSAAFIGAEPIDRATWLCLLAFCANQENAGRIANCDDWGDRRWQQVAGVTSKEVRRSSELWTWDGKDIVVEFYPTKKEAEIRSKRQAGIDTANRRWGNHAGSSATNGATPQATLLDPTELYAEGKGREGKGKEGEGKGELHPPGATPSPARGGASSVVPTEDEVLAWARSWPGMPASGIPAGIPEAWILDWFAFRTRPGQSPIGDWKREAILRFRSDWLARHPKAIGTVREQKGTARAGASREGETARRIRLEGAVKEASKALAEAEEAVTRASGLVADGNPSGAALLKAADARYTQAEERLASARAELAGEVVA